MITKRGKKLTIIKIEDPTGSIDIVAFAEIFEPHQEDMVVGQIAIVDGELGQDDYTGGVKMTASLFYRLDQARTRFAKCLALNLSSDDHSLIENLQAILKKHPGECVVQIRYTSSDLRAALNLASQWRVTPSDELLNDLAEILDDQRVEVCY